MTYIRRTTALPPGRVDGRTLRHLVSYYRPLDEQKGEDEQQHPMARDRRRGPGTPQRPPPWRPARSLDRDSRNLFSYRLAVEPLGLSFAGSGPSSRALPGSPAAAAAAAADPPLRRRRRCRHGLSRQIAPDVSSLAPRGHLQEWLMG